FLMNAVLRVPQGIADGITYQTSVVADAANADPAQSAAVVTTVSATPRPAVRINYSNSYRLNGKDRAVAGTSLVANVTADNHVPVGGCAQDYNQPVIVH